MKSLLSIFKDGSLTLNPPIYFFPSYPYLLFWIPFFSLLGLVGTSFIWISDPPYFEKQLNQQKEAKASFDYSSSQVIRQIQKQMCKIQGGSFMLGGETLCYLSDFEMGKFEISQAQWVGLMGENRSFFTDCPQCPVEGVSWYEVQQFIQRLNSQTQGGFRLPSEAEWEYAAKGGRFGEGHKFSGGDHLAEVGWYLGNSQRRTQAVGSLAPNALGLYDMSGNVWEWCSDWHEENFPTGPLQNPKGPLEGDNRVLRGGSWSAYPEFCSLNYRFRFPPFLSNNYMGFRLVRELSVKEFK